MSDLQANRLKYLLDQYAANALTEGEFAELFELVGRDENEGDVKAVLAAELDAQEAGSYDRVYWAEQFKKVVSRESLVGSEEAQVIDMRQRSTWRRWAVAASILLVVGLGSYFVFFNKGKSTDDGQPTIANTKDVPAPDKSKATITLADGRIISIDSLTSLAQGEVVVTKTADGKLIYKTADGVETAVGVATFNTLSNPRGSKVIDLNLADGSHVWLNAGSSLTYPIAFVGNERKVEITGEAYFEAAHDATKPFIVKDVNRNTEVQVLGTRFNVNTYADESQTKVTLLEGSVKINKTVILKPGQQAQITNEVKIVNGIDIDEVMAWKNGRFELNGNTIEPIMRQIARWYDVDIEYSGPKPTANFMGGTSRQDNLSELLKILEQTKAVKFRIEGKKVIVTN